MIKRLCAIAAFTAVLFYGVTVFPSSSVAQDAPELSGGVSWLNVTRPLSIKELKGRVVLLDFWTFCCINCMHVIPDLKRLETEFGEKLVVIGVHSAKFENEKETDNIRDAVLRYEVEHPVVNDAEFKIWQSYGVEAWPTMVLISPEGKISARFSGEGNYERLSAAITALLAASPAKASRAPLPLALERSKEAPTTLRFPGKVVADETRSRTYIADTNNNRILETDGSGQVLSVYGDGKAGAQDGKAAEGSFFHPQGMALKGDSLYVADTGNNLLRRIDIAKKEIETIAGTGKQDFDTTGGKQGRSQGLNSPWDLTFIGETLYIAMAGNHQIWVLKPDGTVAAAVGSGSENLRDGSFSQAAMAQPSGIATDGVSLISADSETSSIRSITFSPKQMVTTLIGKGLFTFGDVDGPVTAARLQHPLGVQMNKDTIYVADTYNHKIKKIDLSTSKIATVAGTGSAGLRDGAGNVAQFSEPGGLFLGSQKLYVADTNNHSIRIIDLASGAVATLKVSFSPTK